MFLGVNFHSNINAILLKIVNTLVPVCGTVFKAAIMAGAPCLSDASKAMNLIYCTFGFYC